MLDFLSSYFSSIRCTSHMSSHTLPNSLRQLMIIRIRSRLIQKAHSLLIQLHKIAFESQITDSRHIFLPMSPVILNKQCKTPCRAEERSLDGIFLYLVGLGNGEGLCWIEGGGGFEIDVVFVTEDFDCGGCRVGG